MTQPHYKLLDLLPGQRFMLARSREFYRRADGPIVRGRVPVEGDNGRQADLHYLCRVKPAVRPTRNRRNALDAS